VSQPFNRAAIVPAPRTPDQRIGEFWVANPWFVSGSGYNLSGYERNRVYLNNGGKDFDDISALTTADSDGDGRAVVAGDFNADGMEDLLVRQAGGGPLLLFENRFPKKHWLKVSLRGTRSNSKGIGSHLEAKVAGRRIVRELYPVNGFMAQSPAYAHFGLGDETKVDELTVRWPSGLVEHIKDVKADQHLVLTEGTGGKSRALLYPKRVSEQLK
jgi:hypothetical protein